MRGVLTRRNLVVILKEKRCIRNIIGVKDEKLVRVKKVDNIMNRVRILNICMNL